MRFGLLFEGGYVVLKQMSRWTPNKARAVTLSASRYIDLAEGDGILDTFQSPVLASGRNPLRGSELNGANAISPVYRKYIIASKLWQVSRARNFTGSRLRVRYCCHVMDDGNLPCSHKAVVGPVVTISQKPCAVWGIQH